jgi:Methyl-accepting chemotaxis protein
MLIRNRSLAFNIALLAVIIGAPYGLLWGWLLYSGRIGLDVMAWVVVLLLLDAAVMVLFVRGLMQPLRMVSQIMHHVAQGDFTIEVHNPYQGQIGDMLADVDRSVRANRSMMERILSDTVNIASASFETVSSSSKVVFNVEAEENHVHSISEASRQISATIAGTADNARSVSNAVHELNNTVSEGNTIAQQTLNSMSQLAETVGEAAAKVEALGESSRRIGEITAVINDIAGQTNLLALNAAIEAARAGEHGRGFAVVADEVRNLAERTSKATSEIAAMIHTIQSEIAAVTTTMQTGVDRADNSRQAALHTGEAFDTVKGGIETVTTLIGQIAAAASEQQTATEEIAASIQMISDLAGNNTRQAHSAVDTIEQMNTVIGDQLRTLEQFQIPHKAVLVAKSDHMLWKKRLTELLLGRTQMRSSEVTDHHSCRFGKWYYSSGKEMYGNVAAFRAIEEPHRQIHAIARQVVEMHETGNKLEAQRLVEQLTAPTAEVLARLDELHRMAVGKSDK